MRIALPVVNNTDGRAVTEIYRPFFLAGVLCLLTAGCLLGAVALFGISARGNYTASEWTPYILAHANAQLYGWVGLFVMGFALQQHAPWRSKLALFHRLAYSSLALILTAICLRFFAEPLADTNPQLSLGLGIGASILQFVAVCLFFVNTSVTRYREGRGLTWPTAYVSASLFWWLVVSGAEPYYFLRSHTGDPLARIQFVAEWFPPYREAQFLGFVAMMIFGVAFVKLHDCFGFKEPMAKLGILAGALWSVGLLARMGGWVLYFQSSFEQQSARLYLMGGVILAMSVAMVMRAMRVFEPTNFSIRSQKFVRGSFLWLGLSGILLVCEPIHLAATHQAFSHAYIGALRHAVTVGFISQMILGVAAHVVANMNDLDVRQLAPLWPAFWLLNFGNTGRVFLEIASDYTTKAFPIMGLTGFVELVGLLIWAANVFTPVIRRNQGLAHA